ncbi:presenilin-associated rhomboid-like protein [Acrasis kona]|uniref:Presenilin-associated rhomboid-like protein n=1 Tax=Acrasis kona TaxID=1008807 RepID=A0AAW2ZMR8_9EUKA
MFTTRYKNICRTGITNRFLVYRNTKFSRRCYSTNSNTSKNFDGITKLITTAVVLSVGYNILKDVEKNDIQKTMRRALIELKLFPITYTIIGTNTLLWLISKMPKMSPFFERHFQLSLANMSRGRYHTLVTSAFNHSGIIHLFVNMYLLHSFRVMERDLQSKKFTTLYFGSLLSSSLLSFANKRLRSQQIPSVGASGAIIGLVGAIAILKPNTQLGVIFIPNFSFSAGNALPVVAGLELAMMLFLKNSFLDHAGHLGGLVAGALLSYYMGTPIGPTRREVRRSRGFVISVIDEEILEIENIMTGEKWICSEWVGEKSVFRYINKQGVSELQNVYQLSQDLKAYLRDEVFDNE